MKKTLKVLTMIIAVMAIFSISVSLASAAAAPKNPVTVSAKENSTTVILSWDKCEGAAGYRVFQYVDGAWKTFRNVTSTSCAVTGLNPDTYYRFAVKSYSKAGDQILWSSGYTQVTARTESKDALSVKLIAYSDIVYLSWNQSEDATGYRVYQKVGGKWKALKTTAENSYCVNNLNALTNYQFCVKSYMRDGSTVYWNSYYSSANTKTEAPLEIYIRSSVVNDKVTLSWNKSSGATGYRVFRKVNGKWTKVTDVSKNATGCIVGGLGSNTEYTFTVRPYVKTDKGAQWGALPASVTVKTDNYKNSTNIESATSTANSITLKWNSISGANLYIVYQKTASGWKALKSVATNSCTLTGLKSDTTYDLAVRAYNKQSNGAVKKYILGKISSVATSPAQADLTAYRYKNTLAELTSGSCYYDFDTSSHLDGSVYYATPLIMASRNKDFYIKETVEGHTWGIIYRESYKRAYMMLDSAKTYTIISGYDREYFEAGMKLMGLYNHSFPIKVTIAQWNGKQVVCESFYDTDFESDCRFYYSGGQLVGIEIEYDKNTGDIYNVVTHTNSPSASLFTVPSGYTYYKS